MPPKFGQAAKERPNAIGWTVGNILGELSQFSLGIAKSTPKIPQGGAGMVGLERAHRSHMLFAVALVDIVGDIIAEAGIEVDVNIRFLRPFQA